METFEKPLRITAPKRTNRPLVEAGLYCDQEPILGYLPLELEDIRNRFSSRGRPRYGSTGIGMLN